MITPFKNNNMKISDKVYNYSTKHREGFIMPEIEDLLTHFPGVDRVRFDDALTGITCRVIGDEVIIYRYDIVKALYCGLERRGLRLDEWD